MENRFVLELLKTGCGGHEVMTHDGKNMGFYGEAEKRVG
jgi:hypothetical protein